MPDGLNASSRERTRQALAGLAFLFYLLLLAEGPLRKWIVPGASNLLVFLRDPLMVVMLLVYIRLGPSRSMRRALALFGFVLLLFLACITCQLATSAVPALAVLAGARNYFLFVPLCCILRDVFTPRDYARWIRLNLLLALPIGILVLVQYRSGPAAWINAAPGGSNDGVFLLVEDVVRPYGVFSFTLGHSAFAAWMAGVLLAAVSARRALSISPVLLLWGACGVVLMGAFSGSRTYLLLAGAVVLTFVAATLGFGTPRAKKVACALVASLAVVSAGVAVADPALVGALNERQSAAVASEGSTGERVGRLLTEFAGEMTEVPLFGYGLGAGTNVANFLSNGRTDHVLAEYELTRIVQELGPFFGLLAILLRWGLAAWLMAAALAALRRGNLQPVSFLGFVAPVFLVHDVTLQNSMIGIAWFSAGIFLSSLRVGPRLEPMAERWEATLGSLPAGGLACG
ncbi:hypothetical protein [Lichenifustis flavocetrariae]|uniref:O-antigen ligase family protein n=1 Tax=Lichenifustis flavocetrariae TaxID=2949735 RepID=A0AA41YX56_9HYPH|nr:hypothetical protein [Lichenifustis flavocetrariae]MCW6506563.1 hypothetical protein [Lichenifustis flavocetrariae]